MFEHTPLFFWFGLLGLSMTAFSTSMDIRTRGVLIIVNIFSIVSGLLIALHPELISN